MSPLPPAGPPEVAWPALAAVALLTVLATIAHWWLKRRGLIPNGNNLIKVIATHSLGTKRALAIVEVESERFLLGLTDDTISCLSLLASAAKPSRIPLASEAKPSGSCLSPKASEAKPTESTAVVSRTAGRGHA